jgi:putative PIG3 family NAD(P)H quinone oxidoreductase
MPSETMSVIEASEPGGPEVLRLASRPVPAPSEGQVLVAVRAAGINRPDVLQRQGSYPPPKGASDLLGLEIAGDVVATAPGVTRFRNGDAVAALVNGGGYAEYALAAETTALPKPPGLSYAEAACLPETVFTVWHNVFERGHLEPGDWLLLHGGASGIGTTAIPMAKLRGARVIVTAGSDEKCAACEALGADAAINYKHRDFVEAVKETTDGHGADVILDMVGGDYIERNLRAAALEGRIVQIAFLHGSKVEIDLMRLMMRRLTLTGSTLRAQSDAAKAAIARAVEREIWPLVAAGRLRPVIDSTFDFKDVVKAHERIDDHRHIGKIVLTLA